MRCLTWHIPESFGPSTNVGETYRLDRVYVPNRVWIHLERAPTGTIPLEIDIKADGESIFSRRPDVLRTQTDVEEERAFSGAQLSRDTLMTFDVVQMGTSAKGLTVGLELDEV